MALSGVIPLAPSAKAWDGEVVWEVSGSTLSFSLYMWKTDGTGNPSSAGYTNSGSVQLNGTTIIEFRYDQIEYGRTQYGETYTTSFSYNQAYSISASITGLTGTAYSGTTLSGSGTVKVNRYSLSVSEGIGSSITVKRTSSKIGSTGTLSNGSYLYDNDVLQINFAALIGYNLKTQTVNGNSFTSGETHTVSKAVTVASTATPKPYTLSLSVATGSNITIYRQSSYGGSTGNLTDGATVYYDDVLKISFTPNIGYNLSTCTVNGSTFTSDNTYTVAGNVTISSMTTVKSYTLSLNPDTGSEILVYRVNSPLKGEQNGGLSHGATIYHSDELEIIFESSAEYKIAQHLVNQANFESGNIHTVSGDVEIVTITTLSGVVRIYTGSAFENYIIFIYNGSSWDQYIPYVYDGTQWSICS